MSKNKLLLIILILGACTAVLYQNITKKPREVYNVYHVKSDNLYKVISETGLLRPQQVDVIYSNAAGIFRGDIRRSGEDISFDDYIGEIYVPGLSDQLDVLSEKVDVLVTKISDFEIKKQTTLDNLKRNKTLEIELTYILSTLESLEAQKNTLDVQMSLLETKLGLQEVSSFYKGTILKTYVSNNQPVKQGQMLMKIADLTNTAVNIFLDPLYAPLLTKDTLVYVMVPPKNVVVKAKITHIDPELSFLNKSPKLGVEIQFLDLIDTYNLKLGQPIECYFLVSKSSNLPVIPLTFINKDKNGYYVLTYHGDRIHKQHITLGLMTSQRVAITSGLQADDIIIKK